MSSRKVRRPDGSFSPRRIDVFTLDGPRTLTAQSGTEFQSIINTGKDATTWIGHLVPSRGRMVVNFNGNFTGDQVQVSVMDEGKPLFPSVATFQPTTNGGSFSYTFVARGTRDAACHYIDPVWRLASTGGSATITDMVVTITYRRDVKVGDQPLACPA